MNRAAQLSRFVASYWRKPDPDPDSESESSDSSNMSSSGRATTATKVPKAPTSLDPTIIIGEHASLAGTKLITVGSDTIIQSRAKLVSTYAPVTIGSSCILSEKCSIGLQSPSTDQPDGVVIEDYVIVEVGAVVEAMRVGEGSVVEVNSKLGKGSIVGKHCTIGPCCTVEENEVLPDYTVIYGPGERRIDEGGVDDELKLEMVRLQIVTLKRILQNSLAKFQ